MKQIIFGAALTAFAAVAPLGAQGRNGNQGIPPGQMPPAGMCRIWIDGVAPGRQPRATDCATARSRVPSNGRVIYGANTSNNGRYNNTQDCTYSRSTNTVGDIIFGRSGNNTNCVDNTNRRVSGGWYQVGNDRYGAVYERQTRDRNGNLIVQRARRNSNGSLSVFSTRNAGNNSNGRYNDSRYNNDQYDNARYDNSGNNGAWNGRNNRDDNDQGDDNEGRGKGKNKDHGKGHGKGHGDD